MARRAIVIFYMTAICLLQQCLASEGISQDKLVHHLTKEYTTISGKKVFVFDGVIPEQYLLSLRRSASLDDKWRFVLHDEYVGKNGRQYDSQNGVAWKSWQDPTVISRTNVGMSLKDLVQAVHAKLHNGSKINLEMNEIYGGLIRRGDRTTLHREDDSGDIAYTMITYHNVVWRKNSYAETFFYDDDDEIFAVVRAKFGRVVVWESSLPYVFKPPSISQLPNQFIHLVSFSSNLTKNLHKREYFRKFLGELKMPADQDFVCTEKVDDRKLDMGKHLTLRRKNKGGFVLGVFDGLFPEADLYALRSWTIDNGLFFFADGFDLDSDNVQFIAAFTADNFVRSRFWPIVRQMAMHLSGIDTWYPYDVACNLIRSTDHTRIHRDTSKDVGMEQEMTFLLYLSPNWTAEDYGETVFMELHTDSPRNEYVAEVVPLFGRAVIFDGDLPHSARPPSVKHYGPRFTFAVKLAIDRTTATSKMLEEESRHEMGWFHLLDNIRTLSRDPDLSTALHKITEVQQYLRTRQVQLALDKSIQADEYAQNPDLSEEEESLEEEPTQSENEYFEMEDEEDEQGPQLPPGEQKKIQMMTKYHKIEEKMRYSQGNYSDAPAIPLASIFNEENRQRTLAKWVKKSAGDPELLNDYLELYLKQQAWVKKCVTTRMMAYL